MDKANWNPISERSLPDKLRFVAFNIKADLDKGDYSQMSGYALTLEVIADLFEKREK